MDEPYVGSPSDDVSGTCAYSPTEHAPKCPNRATTHLRISARRTETEVTLAACALHERIARNAGTFLAAHPHEGWCGMPGTVWLHAENRCAVDDSGEEPASRAAAEALTEVSR